MHEIDTEIYKWIELRHRVLTWKTHNSGKNHDSPRAAEYTIWEEYKVEENTEAMTSFLLLHHTRRRLQDGGSDLSLSLTHTRSVTRSVQLPLQICDNNTSYLCPKSYLYIYYFSAYLHLCPSNRSQPIGADFVMSRFSASSIRRDMFPNKAF